MGPYIGNLTQQRLLLGKACIYTIFANDLRDIMDPHHILTVITMKLKRACA